MTMGIPDTADIVVIGAGPGGSIAATLLARKGYDVVIFDRQRHPRAQVGESLIPDFWKYADLMGVTDKILDEGFLQKAGGIVVWNGRVQGTNFKDFGFERPALHVERTRFDQILFEQAKSEGAHAFEEVTVTGAEFSVDESTGLESAVVSVRAGDETHSIECKYVVDTSGQTAVLGRQMGLRHVDDGFRFLSIWGYWDGSRYVDLDANVRDASDLREAPPTTFVTSLEGMGWAWHIPMREVTSVGLVLPLDLLKGDRLPKEAWPDYYERRCRDIPILRDLLANATLRPDSVASIRNYSYQSTAVAGPGWILAGDAAGFVDPVFSVGVLVALYSGSMAALAVDRCLTRPDQAERSRSLYASQLRARIEVARSLALPRYEGMGEVTDLARETVKLERSDIKRLMFAVSEMTTRSDNWRELVGTETPELTESQLRVFEHVNS